MSIYTQDNESRCIDTGAIALTLSLFVGATDTYGTQDPQPLSLDYSIESLPGYQQVDIASSDGNNWDTVIARRLRLPMTIDAQMAKKDYVMNYKVKTGHCDDLDCSKGMLVAQGLDLGQQTINDSRIIEIAPNAVTHLLSKSANDIQSFAVQYRQACTEVMDNTINEPITLSKVMRSAIIVDTSDDLNSNDRYASTNDAQEYDSFDIKVRCLPYGLDLKDPSSDERPNAETLDLFLSTFSHATSMPDESTTCKKGRILARAHSDSSGLAHLKFDVQLNGESFSETENVYFESLGSGLYEAEVEKWVTTDYTDILWVRASTQGVATPLYTEWKQLTLECITDTPDFTNSTN